MNDGELDRMLKEADDALVAPRAGDLIGSALKRQSRKRRRLAGMTTAALALLIVAVCRLEMSRSRPVAVARSTVVATTPMDRTVELELAEETANALLAAEKYRATESRLRQLEASVVDPHQQREMEALLLLRSASYVAAPDERTAIYRQVAGTFSNTGAASVAEQLAMAH